MHNITIIPTMLVLEQRKKDFLSKMYLDDVKFCFKELYNVQNVLVYKKT